MSHVRKPSDYALNKKMPDNPRYKNVKPVVDTGASLRRHLDTVEEMRRNFKYRKDELFKRIKLPMFVTLVLEVAKMKLNADENNTVSDSSSEQLDASQEVKNEMDESINSNRPRTPKSTLQSLIGGVGEMDFNNHPSPANLEICKTDQDDPYLLLDIREPDDYVQCHIITAENYPTSMLSRTMNFESKSLLAFKNKEKKIIVLYDEDETRAPKVATTLVQRGYDNVYMLSGGLKFALEKFPKGLITGVPSWGGLKLKKSFSSTSILREPLRTSFTSDDVHYLNKYLISFGPTTGFNSVNVTASTISSSKATSGVTPRASRSQTSNVSIKSKPWK